ncbi:MAG: ATP-binding protein [Actinomycetota bacterium]|nr:ATP-binding protein [Actinomycetota bacterium]
MTCPALTQQAAAAPETARRHPAAAWRCAAADLPAEPRSVPAARRLVRLVLASWALDGLQDTAEMITSELVTNGIAASEARYPTVRLRLTCQPCSLLIEAWDANPGRPELREGPLDAEHGRGLVLVSALADNWGCDPADDGGKTMFAVIAR